MNPTTNSNIHHILNANAMFSFTSGLFFVLAREPLGEFLSASPALISGLGVMMFFYAGLIAYNTQRGSVSRGFTLFTVMGDSCWVLLSVLLLVLPAFDLTTEAKWAIGVTAICVDIFATLQFFEWRKMN